MNKARIKALCVVTLLIGLTACSDDATAPNDEFRLKVRVVDQDGAPVPGLDLMVLMDSPYYQDGFGAQKAAVAFGWEQHTEGRIIATIEDVAGSVVRNLVDGMQPAGAHRVMWDGRDDAGVPQLSGLYWARVAASLDEGAFQAEEREPMFLALMDFDQATVGKTDAAGEIVLEDKRLFPHLYGQVAMQARNENGEIAGDFPLVATTRFYLRVSDGSYAERHDRDVTASTRTITLHWGGAVPLSAAADRSPAQAAPRTAAKAAEMFRIVPPYPNPFN